MGISLVPSRHKSPHSSPTPELMRNTSPIPIPSVVVWSLSRRKMMLLDSLPMVKARYKVLDQGGPPFCPIIQWCQVHRMSAAGSSSKTSSNSLDGPRVVWEPSMGLCMGADE